MSDMYGQCAYCGMPLVQGHACTNAERGVTGPKLNAQLASPTLETNDISGVLMSMLIYGEPRLTYHKSGVAGWCCTIEMNTTSIGSSFTIKSEFGRPTPTEAVAQCFDRMVSALRGLSVMQSTALEKK